MNTYEFTLNIGNIAILSDEDLLNVSDALYATCNDAFVCSVNESMYIEFERKAESFESAIIQAIKEIESTKGYNLIVESVEGDLVSLGDAASVTGVKKSTLSKYKKGTFGGGGFPSPVRKLGKKDPLWRLWDIAAWLYAKGKVSESTLLMARTVSLINTALESRRFKGNQEYNQITAII